MKKIVTFGGGGGHAKVLRALRDIEDITITGICPSTDSGGSTGILQEHYDGKGYLGDLTKCIVTLCKDELLANALSYRYESGALHGHSVKNILFLALEKTGDIDKALKTIWKMCDLGNHRIIPVTNEKVELHAKLDIGNQVIGETNIDKIAQNPLWNPEVHSISEIHLHPEVRASNDSINAIKEADYIIISPGDLYSSIIPVLLPVGIKESIQNSSAKIILILNIMTKKGETHNYTAEDFIDKIENRLGRKADFIFCNNAPISEGILLKYSLESKIELSLPDSSKDKRIIQMPLAAVGEDGQIYSNPEVIKKAVTDIFFNK
ncbi:MAG: gluconeogenesis factor YvcK family protein [archaeon]